MVSGNSTHGSASVDGHKVTTRVSGEESGRLRVHHRETTERRGAAI